MEGGGGFQRVQGSSCCRRRLCVAKHARIGAERKRAAGRHVDAPLSLTIHQAPPLPHASLYHSCVPRPPTCYHFKAHLTPFPCSLTFLFLHPCCVPCPPTCCWYRQRLVQHACVRLKQGGQAVEQAAVELQADDGEDVFYQVLRGTGGDARGAGGDDRGTEGDDRGAGKDDRGTRGHGRGTEEGNSFGIDRASKRPVPGRRVIHCC